MHPSYFLILNINEEAPKTELAISAKTSEWLFHVKFWDKINNRFSSSFSQYEEDDLFPQMIEDVIALIRLEISKLPSDPECDVKFRYGWSQDLRELLCFVKVAKIIYELDSLVELLTQAAASSSNVFCQL